MSDTQFAALVVLIACAITGVALWDGEREESAKLAEARACEARGGLLVESYDRPKRGQCVVPAR